MKPVKFRAWYPDSKEMYRNVAVDDQGKPIFISAACQYVPNRSPFVLMQFTGLKDSVGVEVYEGDILEGDEFYPGNFEGPDETDYQRVIPEWDEEELQWVFVDVFQGDRLSNQDLLSNMKVIGNKYEHDPQMLGMKDGEGKDLLELSWPEGLGKTVPPDQGATP